ncbi:MAG: 23S rRNA (adenine(2503)-C(2))-methyltransferase RlmN [Nitrospiraceae bacterium]|nr:23S rRNA (adenine(2503)-C(2))-methyltransferase RlmN [Nitrospiraceae bacterium]
MPNRTNLKALSQDDLVRFVAAHGLPRYRAGQLAHWIYGKFVAGIDEITEFSKELRAKLSEVSYISSLRLTKRLVSSDGTEKFLFALEDGETIESVLIPDKDRLTLCISSQVGCAMGCKFCLTGELGLIRNMEAHEIADQVICAARLVFPRKINNIVMMGMGEPLANIEAVAEALRRISGLIGITRRRITLSTCGLVPKMEELARAVPGVNLAVSLNASTDAKRDEIMPVNRRYPLKSLLDACKRFPLGPRRRITFEYVLLGGMNDSVEDARRLAELVRGVRCKINLIPFNPHSGSAMKRPSERSVLAFQRVLEEHHLNALVRESRGRDILAACGQLKADY